MDKIIKVYRELKMSTTDLDFQVWEHYNKRRNK